MVAGSKKGIVGSYSDCPDIVREYLFYAETIKNQSKRTVYGYYIDLRTFFRFLLIKNGTAKRDENFSDISIASVDIELIDSVTSADVYEFLFYVTNERQNNPSTRARKLSCLKSFYGYLTNKVRKTSNNPVTDIELPTLKKTLPKYLTLEESLELLESVDGEFYQRDYCIITLLLNCGMRVSELVGINTLDIRDDAVRIVGKGNKERMVFLNSACKSAIREYIVERDSREYKKKDINAFLLNRNGGRITVRRVQQIVENNLAKIGLAGRGYSPHKLRHTAATLMYQYSGADMLALKEILGHEHVTTTEIYTHISDSQLKKAMDSSPLAGVKAKKR